MQRCACIQGCRPTALKATERAARCHLSIGVTARRSLPRKVRGSALSSFHLRRCIAQRVWMLLPWSDVQRVFVPLNSRIQPSASCCEHRQQGVGTGAGCSVSGYKAEKEVRQS